MIKQFQQLLKDNNLNYYIIPTDDDHASEYVGDYYNFRAFLSGFTGSAGTLLVGQDEAYLWTDGRYFLQASKQLSSDVTLMKSGCEGVPTIQEFLSQHTSNNDVLGYNGSVCSRRLIQSIENTSDVGFKDIDLTDSVWKDRPTRSTNPVYLYDEKYNGLSSIDKLSILRKSMKEKECDTHILASLDDIAWLFNIRGSDIDCTPVALSFGKVTLEDATLYLQEGTYDEAFKKHFKSFNVSIKGYEEIYHDLSGNQVLLDSTRVNQRIYEGIKGTVIDSDNPTQLFKAIKNDVEIKNTMNAHIKDGIAMLRFMHDIKSNPFVGKSELDVSHMIRDYRAQLDDFKDISFTTIAANNENGAIVHYHPTETEFKMLEEGLLLVDSGGQYLDGTTDITRMYALGNISKEMSFDSTLVLKGWLALMNAQWPKGTTGITLDLLARNPLYQHGLDFNHGTGHGVGHFLGVHEGPHSIRSRLLPNMKPTALVPGMIVTDEPGVYIENKYGIRWENELLVVESEYEGFYKFKPLTLVPIDIDAIDVKLLSEDEKLQLNTYHHYVYQMLKDHVNDEELVILKQYTKEI